MHNEASALFSKGKGKALAEHHVIANKDEVGNDDDNGEDPLEYDDVDDYVNHAYYRDMITEGFCIIAPRG